MFWLFEQIDWINCGIFGVFSVALSFCICHCSFLLIDFRLIGLFFARTMHSWFHNEKQKSAFSWMCFTKVWSCYCGHKGRKSIDLCCGSKLDEQLKFVATLLQKKGHVVSTY
jgi:hypothetical protein